MRNRRRKLALLSLAGLLALGLLALAWTLGQGSSEAQDDTMHNCPETGKWSIAAWSGQDAMPVSDALAFCPQQVDVAYRIDPDTQGWTRYFRGRPEISNLDTLDYGQGVVALGGGVSAAATASDEAVRATANGMLGCPLQGKWAIAVWNGDDDTDAEQALATCGEGAVAAAYSIDRETQMWSRWFDGRPEISNLSAFNNMGGAIVLGGTEAPATPTPSPTPSPTPTPAPTPPPGVVPGAMYRGTTSEGNAIRFAVSDDGHYVTDLNTAWDCKVDGQKTRMHIVFGGGPIEWDDPPGFVATGPVVATGHDPPGSGSWMVSGTFKVPRGAEGTFVANVFFGWSGFPLTAEMCETKETWTAEAE